MFCCCALFVWVVCVLLFAFDLLEPPEGEHPNIIGTAMSAAMTATQIRRLLLFEELVILFPFPPL